MQQSVQIHHVHKHTGEQEVVKCLFNREEMMWPSFVILSFGILQSMDPHGAG
jgi:hypothetical protein